MKILVVEDDRLLNSTLCYNLAAAGYTAEGVHTAAGAEALYKKGEYDLFVLDVNLPDGSGFDLCRAVKRRRPEAAVIFLTANDMESDQLRGFELGADDYVTKPFSVSVFQKKVSALLGRLSARTGGGDYDDGTLAVDFDRAAAALSGAPLALTPAEYRLLRVFVRNPRTVLTRRVLLEKLWDADGNFVDEHALTAAVSRLRLKLESTGRTYIKTVYGMGYMWMGGPEP